MEYYVLTVKVATGADKHLVVRLDGDKSGTFGTLVVSDQWDELTGALAMCEYLNREAG